MIIKFDEDTSQRLDKYLISLEYEELYSRSFIDKLIKQGMITVNGDTVKKSYLLNSNDEIEITLPEPEPIEVIAQDIPIEVVYEDDYLAIVNKPAGLTVHPAPGNPDGTLVNALMYKFNGNLASGFDARRPGIVHRLDKDTSGLLIVAKDDRTHSLLSQMFQERKVDKYYQAITLGVPPQAEDTIVTFIDRSRTDRKKMTVLDSGKEAITHYKIVDYFDFFSLVDIKLETGRTHQIRVHFSHINCPILGDNTYSSLKRTLNILPHNYQKKVKYLLANHLKRQALHAYKLRFEHPITSELIEIEIPVPEDFQYTLDWLNKYFK